MVSWGVVGVEGEGRGEGWIIGGKEETFGGDGIGHYLDRSDDFMGYTNVWTYQIVHFKHMQFILCQLKNQFYQ